MSVFRMHIQVPQSLRWWESEAKHTETSCVYMYNNYYTYMCVRIHVLYTTNMNGHNYTIDVEVEGVGIHSQTRKT